MIILYALLFNVLSGIFYGATKCDTFDIKERCMVKDGNKRYYVTLSEKELEILEKASILTGASKSKLIMKSIGAYLPGQIAFYERYYRGKMGVDPYTKEPLSEEERKQYGLVSEEPQE